MKINVSYTWHILAILFLWQNPLYPATYNKDIFKQTENEQQEYSPGKKTEIFKDYSYYNNEGNLISKDEEQKAEASPTFPGDEDYNPGGIIGTPLLLNTPLFILSGAVGYILLYRIRNHKKKKKTPRL